MDPVKVASIHDWLTLRNVTEVQSFVGFINFYWCFIQDFSHMAKPLHLLTKKHGDGPKSNRGPSRNSSGNFSWKWMHQGMPPVPFYLNCARMINGT